MVEKLRLYVGATELNYNHCVITKTSDQIINSAKTSIEADSNVLSSSTIDFKKADGTTTIFSGKVNDIKESSLWDIKVFTNGYELNNRIVENVYDNRSPEYIVEDIITNYTTNLTYASSTVSGFTIPKYIAKKYALSIIKDMMDILNWQMRIDENDNVYFEPKGNIDNGITWTNGTDVNIKNWYTDKTQLFNHVKVKGGPISHLTQETDAGDGGTKVFTLLHKPVGTVKVQFDGVEQIPTIENSIYTVDAENKQIEFLAAPGGGVAIVYDYSFHIPIVVENQNDASISSYGEIYKEIQRIELSNFSDARKYAQELLDVFSIPLVKATVVEPFLNFTRDVGELITLVDNVRGREEVLVITKIVIDARTNTTTYNLGPRDYVFFDWQSDVEERIKKLERLTIDEDVVGVARLFKHKMQVKLTPASPVWEYDVPQDSFILGHYTLGRLRPNLNFEADCSNNSHHGTWTGTGIGGSQYAVGGWRLSDGAFNGSDRIITVTDHADLDLSSDFSVAFAIKVATIPGVETYVMNKWDGTDGWAVRIASDNKLELIYSNTGSDSTIKASTALTNATYQHVIFTKLSTALTVYINGTSDNTGTGDAAAGTNANDFIVGKYSTNFFTGDLDEVRLYTDALDSTRASNLNLKHDELQDCVCYLSMDNPRLGDRSTGRSAIS